MVERKPIMMETKLGVMVEVLPIKNKDKGVEVTNYHPFVKSKILEVAKARDYRPPFSVVHSDFHPIGDQGRGLWQVVIKLHGPLAQDDRELRGSASCFSLPMPKEKEYQGRKYTIDENDDWAEKAETKAIGRALAMGGYGNVMGSSIASAEDIIAYKERNEKYDSSESYESEPEVIRKGKKPKKQATNQEAEIPAASISDFTADLTEEELVLVSKDTKMVDKISLVISIKSLINILMNNTDNKDHMKASIKKNIESLLNLSGLPKKAPPLIPIELRQLEKLKDTIENMVTAQNTAE